MWTHKLDLTNIEVIQIQECSLLSLKRELSLSCSLSRDREREREIKQE